MSNKEQKLIAFNWKENPATGRAAVKLFRDLLRVTAAVPKDRRVVAFPPLLYLSELAQMLTAGHSAVMLGAQDVFWENEGAYTGEIGPAMLRGLGKSMEFVIVGHSERRRFLGETDMMVNKKIQAALGSGFRVILCVGEPAEIRKQGMAATQRYIKNQLKEDLKGIVLPLKNGIQRPDPGSRQGGKAQNVVVAYEPIWAIGTGRHCPPEEALAMARFIKREATDASVLYGGSVDGDTAESYLCYDEIDGVLVGGASLRVREIKKILTKSRKKHG